MQTNTRTHNKKVVGFPKSSAVKVLWISDFGGSGYSLVSRCLVSALRRVYDVYFLIVNNGREDCVQNLHADLEIPLDHIFKQPYEECPTSSIGWTLESIFGCGKLKYILENECPDIVISLNDIQIVTMHYEAAKSVLGWNGCLVAYVPVDVERVPYEYFDSLNNFHHVITMNQRSKHVMRESGFFRPVHVLEHPVHSSFHKLEPAEKQQYRELFFAEHAMTEKDIIIMNVNVNHRRKRLDLTLHCFYTLRSRYRDLFWQHRTVHRRSTLSSV